MSDLLEGLGLYTPGHSRAAARAARRGHPGWRVRGTRTRARETDRFVVAVFYAEPRVVQYPPAYQLYAVSADYGDVAELPTGPDSPYWVRGAK